MAKATRPRTTSQRSPNPISAVPENPKPSASATSDKGNGHATAELEATIRNRAYELYLQRGRQDGFAQDDWLQAEAEVLGRNHRRTA